MVDRPRDEIKVEEAQGKILVVVQGESFDVRCRSTTNRDKEEKNE